MSFPLVIRRPIVFFDLETTGLDFKYDRIIEIAARKIHPDGKVEKFHSRINPGIRIPAEIAALTGISNDDVANAPTFLQVADQVQRFFDGADLAGYHIGRFDVKVMTEEFRRANLDFACDARLIVDVQAIFHQKERRDLTAAYKFYCNKDLEGAHSADADTEATFEIFVAQMQRYPDLPKDIDEMHKYCKGPQDRFVDGEGKFYWRDGEAAFNFGKYKSQTLKAVAENNRDYLQWLISPDRQFSQEVVDICYKAMQGIFPSKPC